MPNDPFTINKAKVRELDFVLIKRCFKDHKGELRYLGLPAKNLLELIAWNEWFCYFSAVERGKKGQEFIEQHNLMLTAMQYGLADKLILLRGELDEILNKGKDEFDNHLLYPYDVVSLDYSGGLVYKDSLGKSERIESINNLLANQAKHNKNFILLISTNLDFLDKGEIKRVLQDINRELAKMHVDANATIKSILENRLDEIPLKVYVTYIIKHLAAKWYRCELSKPIFYLGNRDTRMMHFSFWLNRTSNYVAGKPTSSDLIDILNLPAFVCKNGQLRESHFGIPKIHV